LRYKIASDKAGCLKKLYIAVSACTIAFIENLYGWTSDIENSNNPEGYDELQEIPDGNKKFHYLVEDFTSMDNTDHKVAIFRFANPF